MHILRNWNKIKIAHDGACYFSIVIFLHICVSLWRKPMGHGRKPMGHGHKPVGTLFDHDISASTDVSKLSVAGLIRNMLIVK